MVDLSKLKVGDTVKFRRGDTFPVRGFVVCSDGSYDIFCTVYYYLPCGLTCNRGGSQFDIVEIIPKENEVIKRNINGVEVEVHGTDDVRVVSKPKRFVDLLAEGEEFIRTFQGDIWKFRDGVMHEWYIDGWVNIGTKSVLRSLLREATPAQNPERKKKVVYQVLMRYKDKDEFYVTSYKYSSLEECRKSHVNSQSIRLIEESKEEIEE